MNNEKKEIDYQSNKITIQTEDRWPELKEWRDFQKEKEAIKLKYPSKPWQTSAVSGRGNYKNPFEQDWWNEWQAYKKEVTDLMLAKRGNFSKFLYQIKPEREDIGIRIWLRGAYNTDYYTHGKKKQNE